MIRKGIALIVMLLFVGISISSSTGSIIYPNKTKPLGVTISFDPPEPDGDNGWYKTCVDVYFMGDNGTIIDYIMIRIDGGSWQTVPGASVYLCLEGITSYDFIAVDTDGGQWYFGPYEFKIDTNPPVADYIGWQAYKEGEFWYVDLTASAVDAISGMDRVECFIEDEHCETIEGSGPDYVFTFQWSKKIFGKWLFFKHYDRAGNLIKLDYYIPDPKCSITGLIFNPIITNQSVEFFIIFALYTYLCGCGFQGQEIIILQRFTIPNDYEGYIGRFFISATFYE